MEINKLKHIKPNDFPSNFIKFSNLNFNNISLLKSLLTASLFIQSYIGLICNGNNYYPEIYWAYGTLTGDNFTIILETVFF